MKKEVNKLIKCVTDSDYRFLVLASHFGHFKHMSDEAYLKRRFKAKLGRTLNLQNPRTFSEKLQWLKLYDRNPLYTQMVDKYEVKEYVAEMIGEEYIIPTLGIWDSVENIDIDKLPDQFVLKCTHDSHGIVICKDKNALDITDAKKKLKESLRTNFYWIGREWPYKNVKPRIIAEKYMEDAGTGELRDYKFFCFDGIPTYCQVICNRSSAETIDFFDMDWNLQEFTGLALPHKPHSHSAFPIGKPISFEDMKRAAAKLASKMPFVRVDFYEVNGRMYFGEMTFYPASGFGVLEPQAWNMKLGNLLRLNGHKY